MDFSFCPGSLFHAFWPLDVITKLILIVHGFCACAFTYWLKFTYSPQTYLWHFCDHFVNMHRVVNKLGLAHSQHRPTTGWRSYSSSQTVNECPFYGLFSAMFYTFLCFLVIMIFKMIPRCTANVCSSVLKAGRPCCALENTRWLRVLQA